MKASLVISLALLALCSAQAPPIWSITGGPIGIGSCYDIVSEQITFPAYTWHYTQNNTIWVRGQTYQVPDEVYGYSSPIYMNDSRVMIMDSFKYYFHEYVSTWDISAGINIDGVDLSFAFSHTHGQINELLNNSVNYFAENVMTWGEFTLELWPGEATLHPHFLAQVNKLPLQYDYHAYESFIKSFGTHVINKAWYGAYINFTSVFKSDLVNKKSIEWAQNQVKLSLSWMQFNVGINWNDFNNQTHIDNTFIANAQNVTIVSGGQPDVLQSDGFKAWWQTVVQDYALIFAKSQAQPLFEIIPNRVIANNLKQATITYGNGGKPPKPRPVVVN
jgi:hypothetical protein